MSQENAAGALIGGFVAAGFEPVRQQFIDNFDGIEVGASFAVVLDGELVVDLWGGHRERDRRTPWQADTLVNLYSTTKGIASVAVAVAVERGLLDYARPVRDYWPEFDTFGKGRISVGQLLAHMGGVCGPREPVTVSDLYDTEKMTALLAGMAPWWQPGTASGYHAIVWGFLPGELIRRAAGTTLGRLFRETVAIPAGAGQDCYIGLPEAELPRVASVIGPNHARLQPEVVPITLPELHPVALQNPIVRPYQDVGSPAWQMAELAAANGQGNARGIARIYGALAQEGGGILEPATLAAATSLEIDGEVDLVLGSAVQRSRGFMHNYAGTVDSEGRPTGGLGGWGPNPAAFGHNGAGGSIGFADPVARVGCGYAMNQMQPGAPAQTRGGLLIDAFYRALAQQRR